MVMVFLALVLVLVLVLVLGLGLVGGWLLRLLRLRVTGVQSWCR